MRPAEPESKTPRIAGRPAIVATLIGLALTGVVWWTLDKAVMREGRARLEREAKALSSMLESRVVNCVAVLRSARGLFGAKPTVDPDSWHTFATAIGLSDRSPGILALGFSRPSSGPDRSLSLPLLLLEPASAALMISDPDLARDPDWSSAIRTAIDTGEPATSGPGGGWRSNSARAIVLIALPIYHAGADISDVEGRRAAFDGVVFAPIAVDAVVTDACGHTSTSARHLDLEVFDGDRPETPASKERRLAVLFDSDDVLHSDAYPDVAPSIVEPVEVPGRRWTLCAYALPDEFTENRRLPLIALASGIVISILIGALAGSEVSARARATHAAVVATRDLAEANRKLAHELEERTRAESAAASANAAKSRFLASASHEIRTPLHAILGTAELLTPTRLDDSQKRYLALLRDAGGTLLTLVNDLLDLAKIEAGHLRLEAIPFDLREHISQTLALISPTAARKGLELGSEVDPAVPQHVVGDPGRLRQVLLNLLANAIRFSERGVVQVRVRALRPGRVEFAVADQGIGIAAEDRTRIFEAFAQGTASTTRRYGGTGLGLAIAQHLVTSMGGSIDVASEVGRGSVFTFSADLPPAATDIQPAPHDQRDEPDAAAPQLDARGLRILVAEDNEDNRFLLTSFLEDTGAILEFVGDGAAAVARATSGAFDVILMDVGMPIQDGTSATREIRERERAQGRARVPIIAVTAHGHDEAREASRVAGADRHLVKPLSRRTLLAAIRDVLPRLPRAADRFMDGDATTAAHRPADPAIDPAVRDMLPRYVLTRRADCDRLRAALGARDFDAIRKIGHDVRGTAASFGMPELGEIAAALESEARSHDVGSLLSTIDRFSAAIPPS